ncbi:MAG: helix-turn-helix domain-containing protein [Betaproteobacteria bacterium]
MYTGTMNGIQTFDELRARLGKVLKRRREQKGLNQSDLAGPIGLSQADISRIERAEQGFDSKTIFSIAKQLGTSLTDIFAEVEQIERRGRTLVLAHRTPAGKLGRLKRRKLVRGSARSLVRARPATWREPRNLK